MLTPDVTDQNSRLIDPLVQSNSKSIGTPRSVLNSTLGGLSWDDLRVVKAIGDSKTLAAAAKALGVNNSTMFRRLSQVERALAVTLFERRRTGYLPTPAGSELIDLAKRVEIDIVCVTHRVTDLAQEHTGLLRIATSDSLLQHLLAPIIAEFKSSYPTILVEVIVGNSPINLARGEADVAVRATAVPPENLFGRKIATIGWAPYSRRSDAVTLLGGESFYNRQWVSYGGALSSLKASKFLDSRVSKERIAFRADSVAGVTAAIATGLGAGYLPCMSGELIPGLTRIGPTEPDLADDLWLLTHPEIRRSWRVHAFMTHCTSAIVKRRALIEGTAEMQKTSVIECISSDRGDRHWS